MAGEKPLDPPEPPDDDPNIVDDSEQWANLEKELEDDKTVFEAEAPDEPAPPDKIADPEEPPDKPDRTPGEPKPKLTYEQLANNQKNVTEALRRERETRKKAEENLNNVNRLIDELRASRQPPKAPDPTPKPLPSVDEDPIGHFQGKVEMLEEALRQTYQGSRQTAEQIQADRDQQQFWNHVRAHEDEFRKTTPTVRMEDGRETSDYDLACEHLKQHRMAELTHLYPDESHIALAEARQYGLPSPAHLRAAILQQDAVGIAQRAFQLGVSPAQLYYEAARGRGYTSPQSSPKGKPNGQIAAAKRGQKAALTISGGEGRKHQSDMTISDLSDLFIDDPEEFDKQWDVMRRQGKLG